MRRFLAILLTLIAALAAGWLAMRRPDIPYDTLETAYASAQSEFIVLGSGTRIHYRDEGPRDAPVIVMVHGFSSSLHTWEPWVERLKADYRVISLDLPGHGLTRSSSSQDISIAAFTRIIASVTEELGAQTFTLAGNSMGGNTAWVFALNYPERLDSLVLVDASGWPEAAGENEGTPLIFKLLENPLARMLMQDLDLTALIRSGLEDAFSDAALVTDEMVNRYASLARAPGHRYALITISARQEEAAVASAEKLAAITLPVLILQGMDDKLVPASFARRFADAIPGAELVIYEDTGHMPQEEVADRSAADLRAFLEQHVYVATDTGDEAEADGKDPH